MKLFSSATSYLGIDIGTSSIKMVELENYRGQAKLKTYGYTEVSTNVLKGNIEKNNQAIAQYLNVVADKAHVQTRQVVAALPTFSVFNFIINLPPMPKKDLASAIKWEAKKFIPVPIEEMILDWKILNKKKVDGAIEKSKSLFGKKEPSTKQDIKDNFEDKKSEPEAKKPGLDFGIDKMDKKENSPEELGADMAAGAGLAKQPDAKDSDKKEEKKPEREVIRYKKTDKNYRILLTAAPKNLVARYIDIFKRAKFNLLSLETEAFALSRSLIGNDTSTVIIVDIGATTADICVIEQGVPILNRGIDTGGEFITKAITNSLNVNKERAEQFKRDFGLSDTGGYRNVPDVIQKSLNSIINEIRYVFDLYQRQGNAQVDKIVLTGGSAFLPNLPEYLSKLLGLPVMIGDPWDRIVYPLDLKPILQEIGPRMAASIGLAMRDI